MKIFTSISAVLMGAAIIYAGEQEAPTRQIHKILADRFDRQMELRTNGLKRLRFEDLQEIEKLVKFEKYQVPHPPGADYVQYEIWRSVATGNYLILKSGGEAGRLDVYGVGVATSGTGGVEPGGPANGSQPSRSDTNQTSSAASSRR
jgi:hypothetical protein